MPSGRPFSRGPFNSHTPIIEIATYQQSRPSSANKPVNIALTPSPYTKSSVRPNTTESDNQTVCLDQGEQPEDTLRKKTSQRLTGLDEEVNLDNDEQDIIFRTPGLQSEKKNYTTTRKLDFIILPFTFLIYLSDYIQRSNISNATLYGLRVDALKNSHLYYALILSSFSITYLFISIGASIKITQYKSPNKSLSWALFLTSISSLMIGFATNFGTFFICRSLIGMGGAILGKSMEVYYTLMYTQAEMAKRMSFFIGSAVLAGALNGILAYAIGFINSNTKRWSILYFLEGGLGILLAIISHIYLPSPTPSATATRIIKNNKSTTRLEIQDQSHNHNHNVIHTHNQESLSEINSITLNSDLIEWRLVWKTLLNFNIWISSFAYGCINLSMGSLTGYLPLIIETFGYSARTSQILTTWPYLFAFIAMFLVAKASDKCGVRSVFVIILCMIGAIGWTLLLRYDTIVIQYFAIFLVVIGAYCPIPLTLSWTLSNCTSYTHRATSFIIMQTFGQIFTVSSNFIFHTRREEHWPKNLGFLSNLIGNASAALAVSCLAAWYFYRNRLLSRSRSIQVESFKFL